MPTENPAVLLKFNIRGLLPPLDLPGPDSLINCSSNNSLTKEETVPLFNPVKRATFVREIGDARIIFSSTKDLFSFFTTCWFHVCDDFIEFLSSFSIFI